jgi:hypothetical protein
MQDGVAMQNGASVRAGQQVDRRFRRSTLVAAVMAVSVASVVGAACAADDDAGGDATQAGAPTTVEAAAPEQVPVPVQRLEIDARDYTFEIRPDPAAGIRPGWTEVRFRNVGAEAHQVMFARLKDGVDMAQLAAAGAGDSSGSGAIEFVDMLGGVSYIDPGKEIVAMVDLPEGMVLAMCYVPTHEGVAHALLGMSTALQVTEAAPAPVDAAPSADDARSRTVAGTIELASDGYGIPEALPAGWYHVVNTDSGEGGDGLHELSLLKLGSSLEDDEVDEVVGDLAANRTPAVALDALGGLGAVSPGFDGYLWLDLPDGPYLAVDFMPDPGDPRPHMLDGYHATFRP